MATAAMTTTTTAKLILKSGRDKPLRQFHPWIFAGAVARSENAVDGASIDVCSAAGDFLGRGYYNRQSQIVARIWTWQDEPICPAFFKRRIAQAWAMRQQLPGGAAASVTRPRRQALRLINSEGDLLPGLIVDMYGDYLVVQFLTLGAERQKTAIVDALLAVVAPLGIYERSDAEIRTREGLLPTCGVLAGAEPPPLLEIDEGQVQMLVDLRHGQKTGYFLDQRFNRALVAQAFAELRAEPETQLEILNAFAYTGGFGVHVAAANPAARVINLDASAEALQMAERIFTLNQLQARSEYATGNAFELLRSYRDQRRQFAGMILDPPKFIHAQAHIQAGCRGYKDMNLLGIKLLRPGGLLATFSCSGLMTLDLLQKVVAGAATDAGRRVQILARLQAGADHPGLLSFPEGEYLKGLLLRVL